MSIGTDVLKEMAREAEKHRVRIEDMRQEIKALEAMLQSEREKLDSTAEELHLNQAMVAELHLKLGQVTAEGRRTQGMAFEATELSKRLASALRHVLSPQGWSTTKAWDFGKQILRQEGLDKDE